MPVPSSITDLSTTASANFPDGAQSPSVLDDVQRAHGSFIAQLRTGAVATTANVTAGSIDGATVGATTPSTGKFTTLQATSGIDSTAVGATTPSTGKFTTLEATGNVTVSGGTANGVPYLNASKVLTSGTALTFDGSNLIASADISTATGNLRLTANDKYVGFSANGMYVNNTTDQTYWKAANTEAMRLTSTGLGIGTSSPGSTLDARGSATGILTIGRTANSGAGSQPGIVLFAGPNASGTARTWNGIRSVIGNATAGAESASLVFSNQVGGAYTDVATIDASGNMGLGVTPQAWGSTQRAIELAGVSTAHVVAYVNGLSSGTNYYINSGGTPTYASTGQNATRYQQTIGGAHQWFTAPSGTAGAAITFTQAMTLDASGNLGVGVAPQTQYSTVKAFSIKGSNGNGGQVSAGGSQDLVISGNAYLDSAAAWQRNATGGAAQIRITNGIMSLYADSVTTGAITFTKSLEVGKGTTLSLEGATSAAGTGIAFPAAQLASTDPNTLDDYEEGVFTPTIDGTTTAGAGTYTAQIGRYTKVGRQVTCFININWTAHTGTGNLQISGLPFTTSSAANNYPVASVITDSIALTAGNIACAYTGPSNSIIFIRQMPTGGGAYTTVPMDTAGQFLLSITYETA